MQLAKKSYLAPKPKPKTFCKYSNYYFVNSLAIAELLL